MSEIFDIVDPDELGEPSGWSHGLVAPAGARLLFVAGQTGRGPSGRIESDDFADQFGRALDCVLAVVREAGGTPDHVGRMTVYVTDLQAYLAARGALREIWRARMGPHYPAMALVEVRGLVDEGALVEIEATAVLTPNPASA